MSTTQRTPLPSPFTVIEGRRHTSPPDFDAGEAQLPPERIDVPRERREAAAAMVIAIGRHATPEDLAFDIPAEARETFERDPLEREEAFAHVDLLLSVLLPLADRRRQQAAIEQMARVLLRTPRDVVALREWVRRDVGSPSARRMVIALLRASSAPTIRPCPLGPAQLEALEMTSRGLSDQEIARERSCSTSTVRTQLHTAARKLGARSRLQVVLMCRDEGWL